MRRKHLHIIVACSASAIVGIAALGATGTLSPPMIALASLGVLSAVAAAVLLLKRNTEASPAKASQEPIRNLILIYIGVGLIGIARSLINGWSNDDTVGFIVLTAIITVLFLVSSRLRKGVVDR